MPSPEQGGQSEQEQPQEQEPSSYYLAARYRNERPAKTAYNQAQQAIYGHRGELDLSAYRFLLNRISHVAVVGSPPPDELGKRIKQILASGESVSLPEEVLTMLFERRSQARSLGPWVEGHYGQGRRIYPTEKPKQ